MTNRPFNRVHKICEYVRGDGGLARPCRRCSAWVVTPGHGRAQKMCYGLAKEVLNIAVHRNPWGKRAKAKHVKAWRQRKEGRAT